MVYSMKGSMSGVFHAPTTQMLSKHVYTQTNFQRPHFQFDTVWLIDHVKL